MKEILWCIEHQDYEIVQDNLDYYCHEYEVTTEIGAELCWCEFDLGWAYCSPPEEYPDWDLDFEYIEEELEMDYA